jgi:pantoate--beta-alanine ligase
VPAVRIVGAGRAGSSLARALAGAGWSVDGPLARDADVAGAAQGVDLLVIATPDAAVATVAAAVEPVPTTVVAHLAGSLGLDVLAPHPRRASIHPLVSIATAATPLAGRWWAVAGDPLAQRVVDDLGGRAVAVDDGQRAAYHAAACIASNHLVALLGQVERVAAAAGVPLDAYLDLVRGTVDNVAALGPAAALTGPVARGDWATVDRHLAALDPAERPAYRAMAAAASRLVATPVVVDSIDRLRKELAGKGRVGFVPTMGYLHEGHASLMRRARAENDVVVASIFVNPLQFGPAEDLAAYPRDLERDTAIAAGAGVDYLFVPSAEEMYPGGRPSTTVTVAGVSEGMEGASRPSHFAGVATVVAKLLAIVGPCRAYFGEKDFQQLMVVRRLVADLSLPVEVVGCPTVREPDGLAMSSRNVYLSADERRAATVLHRALLAGAAASDLDRARAAMAEVVAAEPLATLDYAEAIEQPGEVRLLVAARVGSTRLIDNMGVAR